MREVYIPPGHKGRQPYIKVRRTTVEALGEPTVDYDKLDSLYREELQVSYDKIPTVHVGGIARWGLSGIHIPYTQSVFINAAKCASEGQERLDEEVLRQSHYLAESVNHPLLTTVYLAGYPTGVGVGKTLASSETNLIDLVIPDSWTTVESVLHLAAPVLTTAAGLIYYNRLFDIRRMGANEFAEDEEVQDQYKEIIVFPGTSKRVDEIISS